MPSGPNQGGFDFGQGTFQTNHDSSGESHRVKTAVNPLPKFEVGDDIERFICNLQYVRRRLQPGDDGSFLLQCLPKFGNQARTAVESVLPDIFSIDDFIDKLRLAFGTRENLRQILFGMGKLFQEKDESVTRFAGRYRALLLKARNRLDQDATGNLGITMHGVSLNARDAFKAGLKLEIANLVFPAAPQTFDEAVSMAITFESQLKEVTDFEKLRYRDTAGKPSYAKIRAVSTTLSEDLEEGMKAVDIRATNTSKPDNRRSDSRGNTNGYQRNRGQGGRQSGKPDLSRTKCFRCQEKGHYASQCEAPKPVPRTERSGPRPENRGERQNSRQVDAKSAKSSSDDLN